MRHLTHQTDARYRSRDKAGCAHLRRLHSAGRGEPSPASQSSPVRRIQARGRVTRSRFAEQGVYTFRRLDLAKVSKATASTMMTPMTICWM